MRVQGRRTDAFPATWELPTAIGLVWLLGGFLALPIGQGIAFLATGKDFVWPGDALGVSLLGLMVGEPGRGLPPGIAAETPSTALVYACAVLGELVLAAAALAGLSWWWRTVGPLAQFGMATRREVAAILCRRQLLHRQRTIRPDLGSRRSP